MVLDGARLPQRQDGLEALAGTGALFDNHYAGIALRPKHRTAYLGGVGGIMAVRDSR